MITGKEDLLRALIEAYLMEKGTNEFYKTASVNAGDGGAQKTYRELADWEENHMKYIEFLYHALESGQDMPGFESFSQRTPAPMTEAGIPVGELEEQLLEYPAGDEKKAIELALHLEGRAYNLYRKLAERAEDPNARVLFKEMMTQEQKHIDYLKNLERTIA